MPAESAPSWREASSLDQQKVENYEGFLFLYLSLSKSRVNSGGGSESVRGNNFTSTCVIFNVGPSHLLPSLMLFFTTFFISKYFKLSVAVPESRGTLVSSKFMELEAAMQKSAQHAGAKSIL